jgi:hypothetical protein
MRGPSGPGRGKYPSRILPEFLKFCSFLTGRQGCDLKHNFAVWQRYALNDVDHPVVCVLDFYFGDPWHLAHLTNRVTQHGTSSANYAVRGDQVQVSAYSP